MYINVIYPHYHITSYYIISHHITSYYSLWKWNVPSIKACPKIKPQKNQLPAKLNHHQDHQLDSFEDAALFSWNGWIPLPPRLDPWLGRRGTTQPCPQPRDQAGCCRSPTFQPCAWRSLETIWCRCHVFFLSHLSISCIPTSIVYHVYPCILPSLLRHFPPAK